MAHDQDIEKLSELLDAVSEKLPNLITNLIGTVYSPKAGEDMGKAVGNLYKGLIEAGIPHEDAIKMAKDYMLTIGSIAKDAINS